MPVTVSFSVNEKHAPVIGGAHFKVYNINCSDPETGRRKISSAFFEPDSGVAGNHQHGRLVVMLTTAVSMTIVFRILF